MAGPACWAAARPVSTKMPVPMMPPMPMAMSAPGPSERLSFCAFGFLRQLGDRNGGEDSALAHVDGPAG